MTLSPLTAHASLLAQDGEPAAGFDPFFIIMLAVFGLLIFFMFRRSKKAQQEQQKRRSSLEPGQEVMTGAGIFGTVVSVNQDDNKVVLELSPGNTVTVHIQAIGQVVEPTAPAEAAEPAVTESANDSYTLNGEEYGDTDPTDTKPSLNPEDPRGDADQK
ncbi:MAG: preprotein translocase subunit YajC [Micrococcaceae bacterium]